MCAIRLPQRLNAKQYKLLLFIFQGLTIVKAAKLVGYSSTRASQVVNSPVGRAYLDELQHHARDLAIGDSTVAVKAELDRQALPAVQRVVKLMNGSVSERIQLNAANSLLDRTVPRKIQQAPPSATFVLPDKVADRLLAVLTETAKLEAAVDVTPDQEDPAD